MMRIRSCLSVLLNRRVSTCGNVALNTTHSLGLYECVFNNWSVAGEVVA